MVLGESQEVCKASTTGCKLTDPSGGYYGGVGRLRTDQNTILVAIWHHTFDLPEVPGAHQARFSPLASRLLPATYGSFTCGNYRRALTKGYASVDPHAPGHGEGRAVLWQPLGTAIQLLLQTPVKARRGWLQLLRKRPPWAEMAAYTSPVIWTHRADQAPMNQPSCEARLSGGLACKQLLRLHIWTFEPAEGRSGPGHDICLGGIHRDDRPVGYDA